MKFLYDAPAILHKGALIVGDTHFGMENKLRQKGIFDEMFSERIFLKLKDLVIRHKVKTIIFLGDVKEDITTLDRTTENILSRLSLLCKIIIVKGNHDGGIENCGNAEVHPADGFIYEGLGLIHGHSWPNEKLLSAKYIVMGHQHPMIALPDSFGKRHVEPVWVVADADSEKISEHYKKFNKKIKLILMPAFNPVVGSIINVEKKHFGPLINNKLFKLDYALLFRLNGICLGEIGDLNLESFGRGFVQKHGKFEK